MFMKNAVDIWIDLKERFSQGYLVRISGLMQEIYGMQQDCKSFIYFYPDLKILWEKLEIYLLILHQVTRNHHLQVLCILFHIFIILIICPYHKKLFPCLSQIILSLSHT